MTDEYKKFMELLNTFNQCADLALDAPAKRQFLKQRLEAIENELLDMNGIVNEETNVNGIARNGNRNDAGQRIRNPKVTATHGRPHVNRIRGRREGIHGRRNNVCGDRGRGGGRCVRSSVQ